MALIPFLFPFQNYKHEIDQGTVLGNSQQHSPLLQSFPNRKTGPKLVYISISIILTLQPMAQKANHVTHLLILHSQPLTHFIVPIGEETRLVKQGHFYE